MPWARAAPLVLVHLVPVTSRSKNPSHVVLHVVAQRIPLRAGLIGLPEWGAAVGADVPPAVQVGVGQGHTVLVRDLRRADGAAGKPERLPVSSSRTSLPFEVAHRWMTAACQR